jgi:hypothetical protein
MCAERESGFAEETLVSIEEGIFKGMGGPVTGIGTQGLLIGVTIFGRPVSIEVDAHQVRGADLSEEAYLACCAPHRLVSFLAHRRPRPDPRRIALFGCACLRLVWPELSSHWRSCVTQAEHFADVPATQAQRESIRRQFFRSEGGVAARAGEDDHRARRMSSLLTLTAAAWEGWSVAYELPRSVRVCPGQLFHDIFGNPFRPVKIDPGWLAWDHGAVVRLARDIYDGRRFGEMPVLGDALEDAGCDDAAILTHRRDDRPHVRGCWLLDGILGRP